MAWQNCLGVVLGMFGVGKAVGVDVAFGFEKIEL